MNAIKTILISLLAITIGACSGGQEKHYYSPDLSTQIILKGDNTARIISGESIVEAEYEQTDKEVQFTSPGKPKNILTKRGDSLVGIPGTTLYLPQYIDQSYQSVSGRKLTFKKDGQVEDSTHQGKSPLNYFKIEDRLYLFESESKNNTAFRLHEENLLSDQGKKFFKPQWINSQYRSIGGLSMVFDDKAVFKFIQANKEVAGTGEYVMLGNIIIIKIKENGKDHESKITVRGDQIISPDGISYKKVNL